MPQLRQFLHSHVLAKQSVCDFRTLDISPESSGDITSKQRHNISSASSSRYQNVPDFDFDVCKGNEYEAHNDITNFFI